MARGQRLVLVSNRLPPSQEFVAARDTVEQPVSGLVSAIRPILGRMEVLWFGRSGRNSTETNSSGLTISDFGSGRFAALDLPRREASLFYSGFSNRTLWPLLHNFPDRVIIRGESYSAYRRVNRRFAESILSLLSPDDLVWVHDFHLLPLGRELRDLGWRGKIGFFLHVPFPSADTFTILPWAKELLEDLTAYSLVGLQTRRYAHNLMDTLSEELRGAQIGDAFVYQGQRCRVGVYPVGTDPEAFERRAETASRGRTISGLRRLFRDQKVILGVDRLDYTKGVPARLLSFEHFLEHRPSMRGKVGMVQISVPSRDRVPEYVAEKRRIDEIVGRINGRFSRDQWIPVNFLYRSFTQQQLAGFFNEADICLVTPIRDGMNLVAKEYVACRANTPGVLVLSKFCGAAEAMTEALIVNPHDIKATADTLHQGLTMSAKERRHRWYQLVREVNTNTATAWSDSFLTDLAES